MSAEPTETATESSPEPRADIAVTGLAVMGANLARNFARHGYVVAVHNRSAERTESLLAEHGDEGEFVGTETLAELVAELKRPRRVLVMVAAAAVDAVIAELAELLEPGDVVIDGGNSHYPDTIRREQALAERGLHFVGVGVSGGEDGALNGPAIMPGGSPASYQSLGPMLEDIAADFQGDPCCAWIGPNGAGHYVKMVHNGIEYADMQVIGEAYDLMRQVAGISPAEQAEIFATWNTTQLESYLIDITAQVLGHIDATTGKPLVDVIVDSAGQKGTGRWTAISGLDIGSGVAAIAESVFARTVSSQRQVRAQAQQLLSAGAEPVTIDDREAFIDDVAQALYASKLVSYAQGIDMLTTAAATYDWPLDIGTIASLWRNGCIIRARLLDEIMQAYGGRDVTRHPDPQNSGAGDYPANLLFAPKFTEAITATLPAWRRVVATGVAAGVPVPVFSSALAWYDQMRAERLPAALTQGLRDYFGAHTYQRVDRHGSFHTLWSQDRSEIEH